MRILSDLLMEQYKNFKIILRNIASLLLLVIGPLALILLVGFAYSGNTLHDIELGVISSDYASLEPAFQNFSSFAHISKYDSIEPCVETLRLEKTHACLVFSDGFGKGSASDQLANGTITFYYDNSRKTLSTPVINAISTYFGIVADQISLESARTILTDISTMVSYVESKNEDLGRMVDESENIKNSLQERKQKLIEIRDELRPAYRSIKYIQSNLDNVSMRLESTYSIYNRSADSLKAELGDLESSLESLDDALGSELYIYESLGKTYITDNLDSLVANNISYYPLNELNHTFSMPSIGNRSLELSDLSAGSLGQLNISSFPLNSSGYNYSFNGWNQSMPIELSNLSLQSKYGLMIDAAMMGIEEAKEAEDDFAGNADEYYNYLMYQKKQLDAAVEMIDQVMLLIEADIQMTDQYMVKIDEAKGRLIETQEELSSTIELFSRFSPDMAEKLVQPFLEEYKPLLPGISNIAQAYPGMIAIIVIFISILFANIVTLTELNSKAFYRNLLAPVNKLTFIFGLIITIILIVFLQVLVLLLVGQFNFGIDVFSKFWLVALFVVLLSLIFIVLGMLVAVLIRSEQSSVLTTTFLALAFFLFSNSVTPIEMMPKAAGFFAAKNPYVIATLAFKKILVFDLPLSQLSGELVTLISYLAVVLLLLVVFSSRKLKN